MSVAQPSDGPNRDQANYWNVQGESWVEFQVGLDGIHHSALRRLIECAFPVAGEQILDIGCGAGASTLAFAEVVGSRGFATGIDISRPLLARAEQRQAETAIENACFVLGDAQTHGFAPGSVDLLVSRFGVMFFADPVEAFRNLASALRPGGRIVCVVWAACVDNPWFEIPRVAAIERLGPPIPIAPGEPGPFALADASAVLEILDEAGLVDRWVRTQSLDLEFPGATGEAAAIACNVGAATRILKQYQGGAEDRTIIKERVSIEFGRYVVDRGLRIPALVNLFGATRS